MSKPRRISILIVALSTFCSQIGAAVLSNARILDWLDGKMRAAVAKPKRTRQSAH